MRVIKGTETNKTIKTESSHLPLTMKSTPFTVEKDNGIMYRISK
jgi:hypothetical protein